MKQGYGSIQRSDCMALNRVMKKRAVATFVGSAALFLGSLFPSLASATCFGTYYLTGAGGDHSLWSFAKDGIAIESSSLEFSPPSASGTPYFGSAQGHWKHAGDHKIDVRMFDFLYHGHDTSPTTVPPVRIDAHWDFFNRCANATVNFTVTQCLATDPTTCTTVLVTETGDIALRIANVDD
jgi:hypothetical protein